MIKKIKTYYFIIPLILLCIIYTVKSFYFPIHDFGNYYFGGYFFKEGIFNSQLYFPYKFNKMIFDLGYENLFLSYAPNTPFLAFLFSPLSLIPVALSKIFFNILSAFLFIISVYRLSLFFNIKKKYLLLVPIVFFVPIKNNLLFGQVYFLLFFLLAEGFLAYKKKSFLKMSCFWGVAILLKFFPIILFGFLVFSKKYKALIYLISFCTSLFLISVLFSNFSIWKFYFFDVLTRSNNGEIAGAFVDNYQSIFMFLKRLLIYDSIENKSVVYNNNIIFKTLLMSIKIGILGIVFFVTRTKKNTLLIFSFWFVAATLVSPYGSTYGFILLIFFYFAISLLDISIKKKIIVFCLLFLISNISFYKAFIFPLNYLRLIALVCLFSLSVYHFREKIPLKSVGLILLFISLVYILLLKDEANFKNALNYKTPLATYNYALKNNTLSYNFWNDLGDNKQQQVYPHFIIDTNNVSIKENQVFYKNKQLTFDFSNKKKPILCNNRVLFLCDKNRGIGFYDILVIDLNNE